MSNPTFPHRIAKSDLPSECADTTDENIYQTHAGRRHKETDNFGMENPEVEAPETNTTNPLIDVEE